MARGSERNKEFFNRLKLFLADEFKSFQFKFPYLRC